MPLDPRLRSRLKLRQLALVVALGEQRSLRKAAAEVAISQPAATKLLQEIETALAVPLFKRHPWGVEPTLYGDTLIRYAQGVLNDLAEARDELAALADGATGKLRVGGVTGAVPRLLVPAIAAVRRERPALQVFLLVNAGEMLVGALRQGTLEAVIAPRPNPNEMQGLASKALADDPLCVVAARGHPLAGQASIAPRMFAQYTWIVQPVETLIRQSVDALFAVHRLQLPGSVVETVSIVATLALLQSENALSVLPTELARHFEAHRLLVRLPLRLPAVRSGYELITRENRELSPAAQAFVDALRTVVRQPHKAPDDATRRTGGAGKRIRMSG